MRMEFWGDEIDSMGYFDISSQRRDETVTECRILPAAEALPTLTPGGTETLCRKMEELAERYQKRGREISETAGQQRGGEDRRHAPPGCGEAAHATADAGSGPVAPASLSGGNGV